MKKILQAFGFLLLCHSGISHAVDYQYKKAENFQPLSSFQSVEAFETEFEGYVQHCLDNTYGGTGGIPCFIGRDIWDRELNIYYKKLASKLDKSGKALLKKSQLAWLKGRDLSIEFNSHLLRKKYTEPGTMYLLMQASDADELITPIIKSRALTLKKWLESLEEKMEF